MLQFVPARRGRFKAISTSGLALHAEAFEAYQVFLDAKLVLGPGSAIAEVIREDGRLLRFSGFHASYDAHQGNGQVMAFIWDSGTLEDHRLSLMAWSEICRPARHLRPPEAARWYRYLERRLPPRVAKAYFGSRGLNHSTAARQLNIARSSLIRQLVQLR